MVSKGAVMENLSKLQDIQDFVSLLINLHETALFNWKIDGSDHYLPQDDIDALIARYKTLKGQLATKYGELL